jgi:hypothetical protein
MLSLSRDDSAQTGLRGIKLWQKDIEHESGKLLQIMAPCPYTSP